MLCLLVATTSFVPHYASRAAVMSRVGTISAVTKKDIVTSELTEAVLECLVDAENEAEQGACLGVALPQWHWGRAPCARAQSACLAASRLRAGGGSSRVEACASPAPCPARRPTPPPPALPWR